MKVPCKDCTKRHASCHTDCEVYKVYQAEMEKQRIKRNQQNNLIDFKFEAIKKTRRKLK